MATELDSQASYLNRNGYRYTREVITDASGRTRVATVLTHIPEIEQEITEFFYGAKECWFEGCKELRAQFEKELGGLNKRCKACDKGVIMRAYHDRVKAAILRSRNEQSTAGNTGDSKVSSSGSES